MGRAARWLWAAILLTPCCAMAAPVAASAPSIRHYDLRVQPDFAARMVRLHVGIAIQNPGLLDRFNFELNPRYDPASVRADGREAQWERSGAAITVVAPKPANPTHLEFDLQATPGNSRDEDRPVIDDNSLFLLWSDRFYPVDFAQWATVTTTVVLPKPFLAIAPGKLVGTVPAGDSVEYRFETSHPLVAFSVFADDRWIRTRRDVRGFHMETLLYPESQKYAEQIFSTSADVLEFFSRLHGGYSFDQFSFVTIEGMYARRAFPGFVGYSPAYLEKEMTGTGYDAHETSLLWWGYTARGSGPGSGQWTEGFGDYVEVMYAEARHKPLAAIFQHFREQYLASPDEQDVAFTALRGNTPQKFVHGKYPWLMHVMRLAVGDDAFNNGIRLLFQRYRFHGFTIDEFVGAFEEASGTSLRWWREQWLERKGVPTLSFSSELEPEGRGYRVTCHLEQQGKARRIPLEIVIRTDSGQQVHRVMFDQERAPVVLHTTEKPVAVQLDPEDKLLVHRSGPKDALTSR